MYFVAQSQEKRLREEGFWDKFVTATTWLKLSSTHDIHLATNGCRLHPDHLRLSAS